MALESNQSTRFCRPVPGRPVRHAKNTVICEPRTGVTASVSRILQIRAPHGRRFDLPSTLTPVALHPMAPHGLPIVILGSDQNLSAYPQLQSLGIGPVAPILCKTLSITRSRTAAVRQSIDGDLQLSREYMPSGTILTHALASCPSLIATRFAFLACACH